MLPRLAVFLLLAPCVWGNEAVETMLNDRAEALLAESEIPGISLALMLPDGSVVSAASGFADVEQEIPLTPDTVMPGGSTGKSYVAAVAMLLVEDGALAPSDLISKHVGDAPWFAEIPDADVMTVGMLLSHTSGLRDHVEELDFAANAAWQRLAGEPDDYFTPEELISFVSDESLLFTPGTDYSYTDSGYIVLGLVIEAASGRTFYDLLAERILEPLELAATQPALTRTPGNLAAGYVAPNLLTVLAGLVGKTTNDARELQFNMLNEWTGGGLYNTPEMLVRFYAALAQGRIVAPATYQEMLAESGRYGYGLFVRTDEELGRFIGHGGWFPGYSTSVAYYEDACIGVAVQVNTDGDVVAGVAPVIGELARFVSGELGLRCESTP